MPCLLLTALVSLASATMTQDTSVPVTYTTRAARASEVVKALGLLAKVNLQTSAQTEGEILVISVKDQPLSQVMSRIAVVTSGEWKQEGPVYRLVPNEAVRRVEERDEFAKRVAKIRKSISDRVAEQKKNDEALAKKLAASIAESKAGSKSKTDDKAKVDTKTNEEEGDSEDASPSPYSSIEEKMVTALLLGIDATVLAQIETGDRFVFTTDPTQTQRSLGGDATEIINNFIQKHNEEVAKAPIDADTDADTNGMDEKQAEVFRQMMKQKTSKIGQVNKAMLIVKQNGSAFSFGNDVELRLYDSKGTTVFSTTSNLALGLNSNGPFGVSGEDSSDVEQVQNPVPKKQNAVVVKKTPIEYSDDSKALMASGKTMGAGSFKLSITPELRRKLFLPNVYDPLSYTQTDELFAYSKSKGKPLVADISDDWDQSVLGPSRADTTLESVEKDLQEAHTMTIVADPTFTVVKPAHPSKSRAIRIDRLALATLMHASEEKGIPSLDDLAEYAIHTTDQSAAGFASGYLALFVPGSITEALGGATNRDMLRFYGHLPAEARNTLVNGGRLAFNALTSAQRAELEHMTFGADSQLTIDDAQHKTDDLLPTWMRMIGNQMTTTDYREEPTELIPTGLPPDGFVDLKVTNESFASPQGNGDSSILALVGVLGPDELAMFKMMKDAKGEGADQMSTLLATLGKLKIGDQSVLRFTFHLPSQVVIKQSLLDHHFPNNALIVAENNLPADFQKQIADRLEALKKTPFGNMGAMFGGEPVHPQ